MLDQKTYLQGNWKVGFDCNHFFFQFFFPDNHTLCFQVAPHVFSILQLTMKYGTIVLILLNISLISRCIMTHYLAEIADSPTQMIGAFIISVPWNVFLSTSSLEQPLNWLLFNRHLTQKLVKMVEKYVHLLHLIVCCFAIANCTIWHALF